MKKLSILFIGLLVLSGCYTSRTHWVDAKGRDCTRSTVRKGDGSVIKETDECSESTGPLATQPYKLDAQITQK